MRIMPYILNSQQAFIYLFLLLFIELDFILYELYKYSMN